MAINAIMAAKGSVKLRETKDNFWIGQIVMDLAIEGHILRNKEKCKRVVEWKTFGSKCDQKKVEELQNSLEP